MYILPNVPLLSRISRFCGGSLCLVIAFFSGLSVSSTPVYAQQNAAAGANYVPAIELLPDSLAGLVRIPNMPRFCAAWEKTSIGQLFEDESMQPFIESQRSRAKNYLESFDNKVGLRPEDLYEIASGEVVISWLPFDNDKRRPYTMCVVADIRGLKAKADGAMDKIDNDLTSGGWIRNDVEHQGQQVRIYNTKPKPGQLKVEQVAVTLSDTRIIAADRDSVVTDLLDAIAGEPKGEAIAKLENFKTVLSRSGKAIQGPIQNGGGTISLEWFAKPFQMARILRESFEVDRGNQVDIIKLLENQGFDAIKAAGGIFALAGKKFDILHRGSILAPPTTGEPSKYEMAAQMLQFQNTPLESVPAWVAADVASFNRLNLQFEEAFWASETLINEAFGDEIFRDIIEGIRDDEDGPQIDIAKNVLPNLDDQVILITDNTLPTNLNSERMLIAIRVSNADAIKQAINKAMKVEPDASIMDVLPGVEIWRVQRGEGDDDFDAELFKDLEIGFGDEDAEEAPPLLDHWAIAMVDKGKGSDVPYLMFSNHPDFLVKVAKRILAGGDAGLA
ncbi:MAG: membrane or secreted protein, partial [Rubripirellula sp.]